ncbi:hypothetical protein Hanom_Chr12g01111541 [Helianthus anomalus]
MVWPIRLGCVLPEGGFCRLLFYLTRFLEEPLQSCIRHSLELNVLHENKINS